MKTIVYLVILIIFLSGCTPKIMQDTMMDNKYFEKITHEDPNAPYIGEWTAATEIAITSIKINQKGIIKMCSSNPHFGNTNGKVFKDNGKIKMIYESGVQYEILTVYKDYLIVYAYGKEYKFYSGKVPENCRDLFDQFATY